MKILWISFWGSWTMPLLQMLAKDNIIRLIVPSNEDSQEVNQFGIEIIKVKVLKKELICPMNGELFERYNKYIIPFAPDIIHIHGTEKNLGQIQSFIKNIPIVISIQGILSGCLPFDNGYIREETIRPYRTLKNYLGRGGYLEMHRLCLHGSNAYEKDIISNGRYFFCRTNWDRAWITFSNPHATIYQGEELLRDPFYEHQNSWDINRCLPYRIFMPSGFNPIKGLHIALKTVALLKKFYPNIRIAVPGLPKHIFSYQGLKSKIIGEEYINLVKDYIRKNNLIENVEILGRLDANEMVKEMKSSFVFLSPSTIDNSSNAVGEAMMLGMPIVCTPVGGLPSFMKDEYNCLLTPAGDEYIAAYQIKRIFDDTTLAKRLGQNAFQVASYRHDKEKAACDYLKAYKDIIDKSHESSSRFK